MAFVSTSAGLALLENLSGTTDQPRDTALNLTQELAAAATCEPEVLYKKLESHPDGLSEHQADWVRLHVGLNEVEHEKPLSWRKHLWLCYKTPFDILLTVLAAISFVTEDMKATIVISAMVVLSVGLRFWQERKSNHAAEKLKAMVTNTATVIRRDPAEDAMEEAREYFHVQLHPKGSAQG